MTKLHFPFVNMPLEFVTLLKTNLPSTTAPGPVFDIIRKNKALIPILDKSFREFDDGRGIEKVMTALGWSNFRERMASIYVYKTIHNDYPSKTDMDLVDEIKTFESRFTDHSVNSYSRIFMLGFYLKLANIAHQEDPGFLPLSVPDEIGTLLKLSLGRSERIDWLVLILLHLSDALGSKTIMNSLISGSKFEDLYSLMPREAQELMTHNLLAYGASIQEADIFLYEKV